MKSERWEDVLKFFAPYVRKHRKLVWGSFFALLVTAGIRLAEPWPLAFAIDMILAAVTDMKIPDRIVNEAAWSTNSWLWICAIGVVIIATLKAVVGYLSTVGLALAGSRVLSEVRQDLFVHLLRLPLTFHRGARSGDLTMRLINDIGVLREVTVTAVMPLLSSVVILFGMFAVMFYLNWYLALISMLPLPLLVLSTRRSGNKIRTVSRQQRKREGALSAKAAEFMGGIATVQALSLEKAAIKNFGGDDAKSLQQNVRTKKLAAALERRVEMLIAFTTALILLFGSRDILRGVMSPGELLIFMSYLKNAFRPVREYAKYTGRLSKAIVAGERVVDLMQREPDIIDRPDAITLAKGPANIRFDNVYFSYPNSEAKQTKAILQGVDIQVRSGQSIAITGPSGVGKSTLGSLLLRLYDPESGHIMINERDLRDYKVSSLRQKIAYVPQDNLLFGVSIRENISLAVGSDISDDDVIAAAKIANAHDFIMALPQGYDTIISERGGSLSGGQRQRIAIARAAVRQCPILILDEPGTGLDSKNENLITDALIKLMAGCTSIVITHNLSFAAKVDQIIFLADGRIAEQGSHEELLALNGQYAELWRLQQQTNAPDKDASKKVVARYG